MYDLTPSEDTPAYRALEISNLRRQYDFLNSIVEASLTTGRLYLSSAVIKAFNYHAIVCLHADAGEYRKYQVRAGQLQPDIWIHVQAQMDDLVNSVNRNWENTDPVVLASFALWKICHIHPFRNGNGRTARLTANYILSLKLGGTLAGTVSLPELLRRNRGEDDDPYMAALHAVDASWNAGALDLAPLVELMTALLVEQAESAPTSAEGA